ncbi:MAG: hypothetical protein DRI73_07335 [Bacteroidetes bacterium]|nr:MAG: hypothetical protein DRI73_07335 [Bacteroidota bacterium]
MLNKDYKDILQSFTDESVKFLLVGAYALAAHGYPRATMDIDLWVKPSPDNATAVIQALRKFGAPLHEVSLADLQNDDTIFQIGVAPRRIDIITGVSGLKFNKAFSQSLVIDIEGLVIHYLSLEDLILNKKASGRTKDLADVEALEALKRESKEE